jgi:hypothetical protein
MSNTKKPWVLDCLILNLNIDYTISERLLEICPTGVRLLNMLFLFSQDKVLSFTLLVSLALKNNIDLYTE